MKHIIFWAGLFISIFCTNTSHAQRPNEVEIQLSVWKETAKEYNTFVEEQSLFRAKLDTVITDTDDLAKIKKIQKAYDEAVAESATSIEKARAILSKENPNGMYKSVVESLEYLHNRYENQVNSFTAVLLPLLLKEKTLYNDALYLSNKYHESIRPIKKDIDTAYKVLKKAERNAYLRLTNSKEDTKEIPDNKTLIAENNPSEETKVMSDVKILITKSK